MWPWYVRLSIGIRRGVWVRLVRIFGLISVEGDMKDLMLLGVELLLLVTVILS